MAGTCEHLEYRAADADREFDHARPYCTVVDEFVQPMRADVCAKRFGLQPAEHCEFYREQHDLGSTTGFDPTDLTDGIATDGPERTERTNDDGEKS